MRYILKELTDLEMKRELQRRDKYNAKIADIIDIFTMYQDTMGDLLRQYIIDTQREREIIVEMNELTIYTNSVLDRIRRRYTCRRPYNLIFDVNI
jgi:predicted methyltransferase